MLKRMKNIVVMAIFFLGSLTPVLSQSQDSVEDMHTIIGSEDRKIYRVSVHEPLDSLAPVKAKSTAFRDLILRNVYETLVSLDETGEVRPGLAESWRKNFDGSKLSFHLRKGVTFHDGSDFDCADLQRIFSQKIPVKDTPFRAKKIPAFSFLKRTVCLDSYEVMFVFTQPYIFSVQDFSSPRMAIFDKKTHRGKEFYYGTGPFQLANQEEEESEGGYIFRRFDDYWGERLPDLHEVRIFVDADDQQAIRKLEEKQIDLVIDLQDVDAINALAADVLFQVHQDNRRLRYGLREDKLVISFNYKSRLLRRKDLRCAIVYATNRALINQEVFYGKAKELYAMQSVFSPLYIAYLNNLTIKGQGAAQIQIAALRGEDIQLKFLFVDSKQNRAIANAFIGMMENIGLDVKADAVTFDEYRKKFYERADYDLVLVNHTDANNLAHYILNEELYGFDKRQFRNVVSEALSTQVNSKTATQARVASALAYQYKSCQHNFLLQRPIFLLSRGSEYKLPEFHLPSAGIDLAGIKVE